MFNKSNFKEWFDRYKYSELAATSAALLASQFSRIFSGLTTAYIITFAEYFAFYGVMIYRSYKTHKLHHEKTTLKGIMYLIRNLFLEFGYPAALDFFFVRPFCMYWMPILTGNYFLGIIVGKITADSFFYVLSIVNYELIKKKG
ncbi:hypothetical protein FNW52_04845 [Flavobacterium sp. ZT3R18]|jgi:hypothetical protein|uniref:hypothetical protein n=1 Tax=Flavobacterium sp. ZT3R18 TaxID=2594429 RepID=UPI00117B417B|nr:hypothetical protein [Flavobacterium sp. ZT3R18]TRX37293.1 hypothetical protein FNW52_04845 [Flavobacterium sp. ZT3R18]